MLELRTPPAAIRSQSARVGPRAYFSTVGVRGGKACAPWLLGFACGILNVF